MKYTSSRNIGYYDKSEIQAAVIVRINSFIHRNAHSNMSAYEKLKALIDELYTIHNLILTDIRYQNPDELSIDIKYEGVDANIFFHVLKSVYSIKHEGILPKIYLYKGIVNIKDALNVLLIEATHG